MVVICPNYYSIHPSKKSKEKKKFQTITSPSRVKISRAIKIQNPILNLTALETNFFFFFFLTAFQFTCIPYLNFETYK